MNDEERKYFCDAFIFYVHGDKTYCRHTDGQKDITPALSDNQMLLNRIDVTLSVRI